MLPALAPAPPLPQVLERRDGVMFKVNMKDRGDCFGEISLMYNCPRSATVAATTDAVVWVLERETFRQVPAGSADAFKGTSVCA